MRWTLSAILVLVGFVVSAGACGAQHFTAEAEFSTKPQLLVFVQAQSVKVGEGKYPAKGVIRVVNSPTEEHLFQVISAGFDLGSATFVGRNGDSIVILSVSLLDGRSEINIIEPDRFFAASGTGVVVVRP